MKNIRIFIIFLILLPFTAFADVHPLGEEISVYLEQNSIDPRVPELIAKISPDSMEFNRQGYLLYLEGNYPAASARFLDAINADPENSFAHYNLAAVLALEYMGSNPDEGMDGYYLERCREELTAAVELEWFWGLQVLLDSDFDGVRSFGIGGADYLIKTILEDQEWGNITMSLYNNGFVGVDTYGPEGFVELGYGYFCIISNYAFIYFPEARFTHMGETFINHVSIMPVFDFDLVTGTEIGK